MGVSILPISVRFKTAKNKLFKTNFKYYMGVSILPKLGRFKTAKKKLFKNSLNSSHPVLNHIKHKRKQEGPGVGANPSLGQSSQHTTRDSWSSLWASSSSLFPSPSFTLSHSLFYLSFHPLYLSLMMIFMAKSKITTKKDSFFAFSTDSP